MKIRSKKTLAGLGIVGFAGLAVYWAVGNEELVHYLVTLPVVSALFGALFVLLRDYIAFDRQQEMQRRQNSFVLGATSHMANMAFDRHVEFAVDYIEEAHETLRTLFQEGPCEQALDHARNLYGIQKKYRAWLTLDIEAKLDDFEARLRKLGAAARFEKNASNKDRVMRLDTMYEEFAGLINMDEWDGKEVTEENAIVTLIHWLRGILGIEELTKLRGEIIKNAANLN